jgi:uncharacterized membrane protein (UPF0127 family)
MCWFAVIISAALMAGAPDDVRSAESGLETRQVCTARRCWQAEVAVRPADRRRGLMNRDQLKAGSAMLFCFPRAGAHPFWMRNTRIPLDIIWLDSDGRVVHLVRNARPCPGGDCPRFYSPAPARYVIEINSGQANTYGIAVGTRFDLNGP